MDLPADPGRIFASDVHRRVLGHLPLPGEEPIEGNALVGRLDPDVHTPVGHADHGDLAGVLEDLETEGYAEQIDTAWQMTDAGLEALQAPVPGDG